MRVVFCLTALSMLAALTVAYSVLDQNDLHVRVARNPTPSKKTRKVKGSKTAKGKTSKGTRQAAKNNPIRAVNAQCTARISTALNKMYTMEKGFLKKMAEIERIQNLVANKFAKGSRYTEAATELLAYGGGNLNAIYCSGNTTGVTVENMTDSITNLQACQARIEEDCKAENFQISSDWETCVSSIETLATLGQECLESSSSANTASEGCDCWLKQEMTDAIEAVKNCKITPAELNALRQKSNKCVKESFVSCKNERIRGLEAAKECARNFASTTTTTTTTTPTTTTTTLPTPSKCGEYTHGLLMVGGITPADHRFTGFYNPATNRYCKLPHEPRTKHAVTGLTACGDGSNIGGTVDPKTSCKRFSLTSGEWETSHTYPSSGSRTGAVAWQTDDGIYLMGGQNQQSKMTTTLLHADGTESTGFSLSATSRFSCAVEDVKKESIIIIGGDDGGNLLKTVYRYDKNGVVEQLPDLNTGRASGCAGYYNERGFLVLLVFGGAVNGLNTEMLVVGQDDAWTELGDESKVESRYPFAATLDNDIFMQDSGNIEQSPADANKIKKWDKATGSWIEMIDIGYTRWTETNLASIVPLDSGIEKWCIPEPTTTTAIP